MRVVVMVAYTGFLSLATAIEASLVQWLFVPSRSGTSLVIGLTVGALAGLLLGVMAMRVFGWRMRPGDPVDSGSDVYELTDGDGISLPPPQHVDAVPLTAEFPPIVLPPLSRRATQTVFDAGPASTATFMDRTSTPAYSEDDWIE